MEKQIEMANIDGKCNYAEFIDGEHMCRRTGRPCTHLDENGVPLLALRCTR